MPFTCVQCPTYQAFSSGLIDGHTILSMDYQTSFKWDDMIHDQSKQIDESAV
jgi:hypothetical protein